MFYAGEIGRLMTEKVRNKEAILYDGALETLQYLKDKGYYLVYLSNCRHAYMDLHSECFGLHNYFDGMYCAVIMSRNRNMKYFMRSKKNILPNI